MQQFMDDLKGKALPDHIMKVIDEELKRFMQMNKDSSEF